MPRKPGLGPPIIAIEDIATGQRLDMVDDFTGLALAQPSAKPPRIQDGQAETARLSNARVAEARQLLADVGFGAKDTPQDTQARPKALVLRRL